MLVAENDKRNFVVKRVSYLKEKRAIPQYITKSLMDCIGNPEHPYDGRVEVDIPIYITEGNGVVLFSTLGVCKRLEPVTVGAP